MFRQFKLTLLLPLFLIQFIIPPNLYSFNDLIRQFELVMDFDEAWEAMHELTVEVKAEPQNFLKLERLVISHFSLAMYYMEQNMPVSSYKHANYGIFFTDHALTIRKNPPKLLSISANLHCIKAAILINSYIRFQELSTCLEQIDRAVSIAKNNKKVSLLGEVQFLLASLVRGFNSALLPKSLKRSKIGISDLSYVLNTLNTYASLLPTIEHQRIYINMANLYRNIGDTKKAKEMAQKVIQIDSDTKLSIKAIEFMKEL